MDNNHSEHGHIALLVSVLTGFLGWLNAMQVSELLKNISMTVSIAAGIMAIRHYWLQNRKKPE